MMTDINDNKHARGKADVAGAASMIGAGISMHAVRVYNVTIGKAHPSWRMPVSDLANGAILGGMAMLIYALHKKYSDSFERGKS
jgi:hypothetical protein